jgi:hypothetical protein
MCENLETNFGKLRQVAWMPSYWGYRVIIYFLVWPVTGTDLQSPRDWGLQAMLSLAVTMCYICSHYIFVTLAANVQAYKPYVNYPAGWGVVAALAFAMVIQSLGSTVIAPNPSVRNSADLWSNAVFSMLSVVAFEWFYHRYVFGSIAVETPRLQTVKIGSQDFEIDDLLYIQGRERHVCLATVHGDVVERSRLRDLMFILADIPGVQPHRSYWVRRDVVDFAVDRGLKSVLSLCGIEIPIARTRRDEVFDWLRENAIDIRADNETA